MNTVRFERSGAIGAIVLDNPPFNRIDNQFSTALRDAVQEASSTDIRVLALRAAGPNFCLGGDLREWVEKDVDWFRTYIASVNTSLRTIEGLRVPTVAFVKGKAIGGGFELALACDFIVAAEESLFLCVETSAGMVPLAGGLQRLAVRVGRARALHLAMFSQPIKAVEANRLGIVSHLARDADFEDESRKFTQQLAEGPTRAYAAARTLLKAWSVGGISAADMLTPDVGVDLFETADAVAGIRSRAAALETGTQPASAAFAGR